MLAERILRQTDQRAYQQSTNLAAPHQGEIHHYQEWHLHETEEVKEARQEELEQDGRKRHDHRYPRPESRDIAFPLAAEKNAAVGIIHQRPPPPGGTAGVLEGRLLLSRKVFAENMILRVAQRLIMSPQAIRFGGRRRGTWGICGHASDL